LKALIHEHMKDMNKKHIPEALKLIKELIFHEDYNQYINVFDNYNRNIIDIEETILLAKVLTKFFHN
jgi:hypothetical protein